MPKSSDPSSSYAERKAKGRRMLSVWIPARLYTELRVKAVRSERTLQQVTVEAVKEWLKR